MARMRNHPLPGFRMVLLSGEVETWRRGSAHRPQPEPFRMVLLSGEVETDQGHVSGPLLQSEFRMVLLSGEVETIDQGHP